MLQIFADSMMIASRFELIDRVHHKTLRAGFGAPRLYRRAGRLASSRQD